MFSLAKIRAFWRRLFFIYTPEEHEFLCAEVREIGPALCASLLEAKKRTLKPLSMNSGVQVHLDRAYDRTAVLERPDLTAAIDSKRYSGRELAVLEYLTSQIGRLGERVGTVVVIGVRGASFVPFYILDASRIAACSAPRR
jgi:hypothetical protein